MRDRSSFVLVTFCIIGILLAAASLAGCTSPGMNSQLNQVKILMNKSDQRLSDVNWSKGTQESYKLETAKANLQEAASLLDKITPSGQNEKDKVDTYRKFVLMEIQYIDGGADALVSHDHMNKASAYMKVNDYISAKSEVQEGKKATASALVSFKNAAQIAGTIDVSNADVADRDAIQAEITVSRTVVQTYEDLGSIYDVLDHMVDGINNINRVNEAVQKKDYSSAKSYLSSAKNDLIQSRDILTRLKQSPASTTAADAILLEKQVNDLIGQITLLENQLKNY